MDVPDGHGGGRKTAQSKGIDPADRSQRPGSIEVDGPNLGPLPRFSTIGFAEKLNLQRAMRRPLSGYLGGIKDAGYFVSRLQDEWCTRFGCKHAVPCNSATSGLLAACIAIGIKPGDTVWCPVYTMSASAACAKVLGANIVFIDIETTRFSMNMSCFRGGIPKCIIVTNLFGHPAYLSRIRSWCDSNKVWMIEDNAQSPLATENGRYAGTIGHIGVFSLNVHKHIQTGEGGVVVTDSGDLCEAIQGAINHGELAHSSVKKSARCGLNLRMTEPTAAIACAQLAKASGAVQGRIELAQALTGMFSPISWVLPPREDTGCRHVYYLWAARILEGKRRAFGMLLRSRGFPIYEGYSPPLNLVFGHGETQYVMAERMEYKELMSFEVCMYDPRKSQLKRMAEIVDWAANKASI